MAWTPQQVEFLQLGHDSGMTWRSIGQQIGKSREACREKFEKLQGKTRVRDPGSGDGWNEVTVRHNSLAFAIDGARFFGREL